MFLHLFDYVLKSPINKIKYLLKNNNSSLKDVNQSKVELMLEMMQTHPNPDDLKLNN